MDVQYKTLYREVQNLRFKVHDLLDDKAHPVAQALRNEVQRLEDELEMNKKPRSLEDRVKAVQKHLAHAKDSAQINIMNVEHLDFLHDRFEDMRRGLRRMSNY